MMSKMDYICDLGADPGKLRDGYCFDELENLVRCEEMGLLHIIIYYHDIS